MSFREDLAFGKKYEMELLKYVEHDAYEQSVGKFSDWDMKLYNGTDETTYEVKADRLSYNTGNIAIEYKCRGKDSGIRTSKADNYVIFDINGTDNTHKCYIIPTSTIREMIDTNRYYRDMRTKFDTNMYLFKKSELNEYLNEPKYEYEYNE
jgi:hypothetical protein